MSERGDQDWLDELPGNRGQAAQYRAHEDLAKYLYVVAYNYLRSRQTDLAALASSSEVDLAALAQDFVQNSLERLARDNFALLDKYSGRGRFTSWVAQIVRREAARELRRPYWTRREPVSEREEAEEKVGDWLSAFEHMPSDDLSPEHSAIQRQAMEILQACLQQLAERRRIAFWTCIVEGRNAETAAKVLNTTPNGVYLLVCRAKRDLRRCLGSNGMEPSILEVF